MYGSEICIEPTQIPMLGTQPPLTWTATTTNLHDPSLQCYNNNNNNNNSFVVDTFPTVPQLQQQRQQQQASASSVDLLFNNNNNSLSRKRSRDSITVADYGAALPQLSLLPDLRRVDAASSGCVQRPKMDVVVVAAGSDSRPLSFLGEDLSFLSMQQQYEMDRFISSHMEKVRSELEERRRAQSRRIVAAIEAAMMKRLRDKEAKITESIKMNLALEEKIKQLCLENQIWRELAQANEATANELRTKIEHLRNHHHHHGDGFGLISPNEEDDAASCCGSNGGP